MKEQLNKLRENAAQAIERATNAEALEAVRVKFLGRKGALAELMAKLATLEEEARREVGALANEVKSALEGALLRRLGAFEAERTRNLAETEWIDTTAPGVRSSEGHLHLTTHAINDIVAIFTKLGFSRVRYPEVDWDYYAFEGLNMPPEHPARDEWETFFIDAPPGKKGRLVLTPHISNTQVHEMERGELPIRALYIYKSYRRQSDVSHLSMFHQFETLFVDDRVTFADLKGVIEHFVGSYFGRERKIRLRPFHFTFTEPSFEVDISCGLCKGVGCRFCKAGWVELAGAGLVHPNVLRAGGIDAKKYQGFAFAFGVERTAMMRAGLQVDDIRLLYQNDFRFLKQF